MKAQRTPTVPVGVVNYLAHVEHAGKRGFPARFDVRLLLSRHAVPQNERQGPMSEQELAEHEIRSVAGEAVGGLRLISESRGRLTAQGVMGIVKEAQRALKTIKDLSKKLT
jgi:hypothetical protein